MKKTISIGMTGTSKGMTDAQRLSLKNIFSSLKNTNVVLHHGDCVGADKQAHDIATSFGFYRIIHPPDNDKSRAFCHGDVIHDEKPYLVRNHDIVDSSKVLIAFPKSKKELLRSGTWATVRYARKIDLPVAIVYPDGKIELENFSDKIFASVV